MNILSQYYRFYHSIFFYHTVTFYNKISYTPGTGGAATTDGGGRHGPTGDCIAMEQDYRETQLSFGSQMCIPFVAYMSPNSRNNTNIYLVLPQISLL